MTNPQSDFETQVNSYIERLSGSFSHCLIEQTEKLAKDLRSTWIKGKQVFICGNGGSAANAIHMANDFHYGIGACGSGTKLPGLKVEALSSNSGVITGLAIDTGYENSYSHQLEVKSAPDDILIVLSGSGNSANVIKALNTARIIGLKS